jgi:hypothetical protein
VAWDPNYEYGNINESNDGRGPPLSVVSLLCSVKKGVYTNLDTADQSTIINHDSNSIDNDLHQQLNLKHPKE